jgi:enoyl-CoA hydratase
VVELTIDGAIATLVLSDPDKYNALGSAMLDALERCVAEVKAQRRVRGAIITGAGRAFSAGADISEIERLDRDSGLAFAFRGQTVFSRIEKLAKPVVAAINGIALGGGCELAMACHMRVASSRARLGQPEVKLGVLPGFGGTQRLPRLVGRGRAIELIVSGRNDLRADEALRIGLVDEVVEPDALLPRCKAILESTLKNGPGAIAASLKAVREGLDLDLDAGLALEARLFADACGSAEKNEGTRAFLEKRDAKFDPEVEPES